MFLWSQLPLLLYRTFDYAYIWCLFLYPSISTGGITNHSPITPPPPTTPQLLQKVTTLKACQPAQGSSTDKWLPRGIIVPTQHHKMLDQYASKSERQTFSGIVCSHFVKPEREHTCQNDSTGALRNMEKDISRSATMPLYDIQTPQVLYSYL